MTDANSRVDQATPPRAQDVTKGLEPPLTLGPRRLHYQFSVALPAVHLTFVSIVQGVVVTQLLAAIPLPSHAQSTSLAALDSFIIAQYTYLAYFISGALILLVWKQFVQASLFYTWPLTMTQIALMLLIASAEMIAFREISHFYGWLFGIGMIGLVGGVIRLHNIPLRDGWDYEFADGKLRDNQIELYSGLLYLALGSVICVFAATEHFQWVSLGLSGSALEWTALLILAGIVGIVIVLDRLGIKKYIEDALGTTSDLVQVHTGSIRYGYRKPGDGKEAGARRLLTAAMRWMRKMKN